MFSVPIACVIVGYRSVHYGSQFTRTERAGGHARFQKTFSGPVERLHPSVTVEGWCVHCAVKRKLVSGSVSRPLHGLVALLLAMIYHPTVLVSQPTQIAFGSSASLVAFAGSHFRDLLAGPEVAGFLQVSRHSFEVQVGASLGVHSVPTRGPLSEPAVQSVRGEVQRIGVFAAARYHAKSPALVTAYVGGRVGFMQFDSSAVHTTWELSSMLGGSLHLFSALAFEFGARLGLGYVTHRPMLGLERSPGLGGVFAAQTGVNVTLPDL